MLKSFCGSFLILIIALPSHAGWFSDDKEKPKHCYNWYGEKEYCNSRHTEKNESYVGFNFLDFNGDEEESLVGNQGFGLTYLTTTSQEAFRFIYGGSLYMADGNVYVGGTRYLGTLYSGELLLGFSLKAYRRATVRPLLEVVAAVGFKSLEMNRAPTGVDNRTFGFSYGGKASMGMEFGFWRPVAVRATVDYYAVAAPDIAGSDSFPISALGASLGLTFFH